MKRLCVLLPIIIFSSFLYSSENTVESNAKRISRLEKMVMTTGGINSLVSFLNKQGISTYLVPGEKFSDSEINVATTTIKNCITYVKETLNKELKTKEVILSSTDHEGGLSSYSYKRNTLHFSIGIYSREFPSARSCIDTLLAEAVR